MSDEFDDIVAEQPKAEPEIPVTTAPRDLVQSVADISFSRRNREIVINIDEGEDQGNGFVRVKGRQRTIKTKVDATPILQAMANKSAAQILGAMFAVALVEGTKEIVEEE